MLYLVAKSFHVGGDVDGLACSLHCPAAATRKLVYYQGEIWLQYGHICYNRTFLLCNDLVFHCNIYQHFTMKI
jgi:hypothetical protein